MKSQGFADARAPNMDLDAEVKLAKKNNAAASAAATALSAILCFNMLAAL